MPKKSKAVTQVVVAAEVSISDEKKPTYKALDQRTHVLHRPDMYIGSVKNVQMEYYGATQSNETLTIIKKEAQINPGLHRIFIEVLSNAIDNVWRSSSSSTPTTKIKVDISRETGEITVWNDGQTIPIEIDKETGVYNPEMLFGRLLTSSNYNDEEERMTSGRNGLGSKATNIFSSSFSIKTFDPSTGKQYVQTWTKNMAEKTVPKITTPKQKTGYTEFTFTPEYALFGVEGLSESMVELMYKHIVDTAMITNVGVFYNGIKVPVKSMKDYAALYYVPIVEEVEVEEDEKKEEDSVSVASDTKLNKSSLPQQVWIQTADSECVLQANTDPRDGFHAISFVNGIETRESGVHVDQWSETLFRPLLEKINDGVKKGSTPLTMKDIKPYFRLFLNCKVPNPAFTSQEKSKLVSPGVTTEVTPKHINAIMKWSVVTKIKEILKSKELLALKKTEKKQRSFVKIEGLDSANLAGGKQSSECSLILTEGLSAKTFAVLGLDQGVFGKKGRDYLGIFPLKGKVLNVRNSNVAQISANKEIGNLIKILNLRFGVDYTQEEEYKTLSYGRVISLVDQDYDGVHIMSLLANFFHKLFPSLLDRKEPYLTCMLTPIVRIYEKKTELAFYTMQEYKAYAETHAIKGEIKYLKGLGSSNNKEVKSVFGKRMITFSKDNKTDSMMDKCFLSKFADQRKQWIAQFDPVKNNLELGKTPLQNVPITDYLDKELIKFSVDDCHRSIASVADGLKESQRKVLFATFLKNLSYGGKSLKVAQLGAYVAEKTSYHHGETSIFEAIIKMCQNFTSSNNIPLLFRDGQFGSLSMMGEDSASPRYIFTKLDRLTRLLFRKEDDALLTYLEDEGEHIEPKEYCPIIPTVLVNGTIGIGSGWSSNVPLYNPIDMIQCIRAWLDQECYKTSENGVFPDIHPWYMPFGGTIEKVDAHRYTTKGVISRKGDIVTVSMLPIGMSIDSFKSSVEELLEQKKIKSFKNFSTDNKAHFDIKENASELELTIESLKLASTISTSNMVLFDTNQRLRKYETVNDILEEFCMFRYSYYVKRKQHLLKAMEHEAVILRNKSRFLTEVMSGALVIQNVDEDVIITMLQKSKYFAMSKDDPYSYLLSMHIRSFSKQKIDELTHTLQKTEKELEVIRSTSEAQMWKNDLVDFEKEYKDYLKASASAL